MSASKESCCVYNCSSVRRKHRKLMFHAFPKTGNKISVVNDYGIPEICDRRKLWENKLRMGKNVSKFMKVCSRHFTDDDYECSGWSSKKRLRMTAVPSQNLPAGSDGLSEMRKGLKQNRSQPSTSSSGPPSVETFIKDEPSCSQEEVLDTAPTFELLPEQTEQPLSMATRSKPYTGSSDKVYCRLCLKPAHQTSLTPLSPVDFHHPEKDEALKKKKLEEIEEVNKMLKFCFPFYDSLTFGPVICSSCLARLKLCYEFSTECLKSQQLVEKYADKYCTTERLINLDEMIEKMSDDEKAVPDIPNVSSSRVSRKKRHSNEDSSPAKKQRVDHETQEEDYSSDSSDEETSIIKFEPDDDDSCTLSERLKKETDDDDSCALSKRLKKEPDDDDDAFTEDLPHDTRQSYVIDPNKFDEEIKVESMYIDHPDYIKDEPVDDLFIDNREFNERTNIGIDIRKQQPHFHETKNVPAPVSGQVFSNVGSSLGDSTSDVIK